MSVWALLEELNHLGVELQAVGDTLEYEGPEEAITPELLDRLRRHKTELVRLLPGDHGPGRAVGLDPAVRELRAAGWKPKERSGKTIYQSPQSGFWYSQKIALQVLESGSVSS